MENNFRSEKIDTILARYSRILLETDKMSADFNVRVGRYLRWSLPYLRALSVELDYQSVSGEG
jgi:hypothetical protein